MKIFIGLSFIIGWISLIHPNCDAQNSHPINEKYVVVVDVQEGFLGDEGDTNSLVFLQAINSIIEQSDPDKIIYVQALHLALSVSLKAIKVDTLPTSKLDNRLNMVGTHFFEKSTADAFSSGGLAEFMSTTGAKELIIVGLLAEKCVYNTVLGALDNGYTTYIIPEAIAGKSQKSKEKALKKLIKKGAILMQLNDLIPVIP